MCCEICQLDSTVDTVMWTCVGCSRSFHPACVGVTVQRNSLRKKEKKVDVQSYVLPCCSSCQNVITLNCDFASLVKQQEKLADDISKNSEIVHRLNQQNKAELVHETIDRVEELLNDNKKELALIRSNGAKTSMSADDVVVIKNHLTHLNDFAVKSSKAHLADYMQDLAKDLVKELQNISEEFQRISRLTIEMAGHCNEHNKSQEHPIKETLNAIKSLATNLASSNLQPTDSNKCTPQVMSPPSVLVELDATSSPNDHPPANNPATTNVRLTSKKVLTTEIPAKYKERANDPGWRIIRSSYVWKTDSEWAEYDAKELRRLNQQKAINNVQRQNQRNFSRCFNSNSNALPSDRELLAAAKVQFSRPPVSPQCIPYRPTIGFQRGEVLNPCSSNRHPFPMPVQRSSPRRCASGHRSASKSPTQRSPPHLPHPLTTAPRASPAPCEACACRHSCFRVD